MRRIPLLLLALGLFAGLMACQDSIVVAPDDIQPQFAKVDCDQIPTPPHPSCKKGGDDPGGESGTILVLSGGVVSAETYHPVTDPDPLFPPDAAILVDNKKKFVGETDHDPRKHGLTPYLAVQSGTCDFDLPDDFRDQSLLAELEAGEDYPVLARYLTEPRLESNPATVVVLWNSGRDATIKFWGTIDLDDGLGNRIPAIHLLAGPTAERNWGDGFTEVFFPTVETIRVVFGTIMGGGSVTCTELPAQGVTATFYPL